MSPEPWTTYVTALERVGAANTASTDLAGARSRLRREHLTALEGRGRALAAQKEALDALAERLRAAPTALPPTAPAVPTLSWADGLADLDRHLTAADRAAEQARNAGHLPQLLPQWSGTRARNAVIYAALCIPNAAFSAIVSLVGAEPSSRRFLWFLIVFPVLVAVTGVILIGRIAAPRIVDPAPGPAPITATERRRRSVLVGLLIAWASWIVPGQVFELLRQLIGG